jgi:coenzyme PQQ synthesis protein D (PqqD)
VIASSVYARNPAALWRRVGDEVLLTARDKPEISRLSVPATSAWLALAQPMTQAELTKVLAEEFEVDAKQIVVHVERLIEELEARGWLVEGSSGA